jgi:hypothetical protein
MAAIDCEWLDERITATKAAIVAHEAAITAVVGGAQTYQLDSGQTRMMVTRANLSSIRAALEELENRLATLDARKCGAGSYGRPGF